MKYAFFNDVDNDRLYFAEDFAAYFAKFIGNGVYASPAASMQVSAASSGLAVKIADGGCFINGYYANAENEPLITLSTAHGSYGRYDLIVARLDFTKRDIHLEKITGTAAESPAYPEIVRNDVQYDIALAAVFVPANALSISDADITDLRSDNAYCGFVSGVVEQIDTTELFKQYQAAWDMLMAGAALDEPAIIEAFNALQTVKKINGTNPDSSGNFILTADNLPDGENRFVPYFKIKSGVLSLNTGIIKVGSNYGVEDYTITFDEPFSTVPIFTATPTFSSVDNENLAVNVVNISADKVDIKLRISQYPYIRKEKDVKIYWIAMGV